MQKSLDEGRSSSEAEGQEFDTLQDEIKSIDSDLVRLHQLEKLNAQKAAPAAGDNTKAGSDSRTFATVKNTQKLAPGIEFARYAICLGQARGNIMQAYEIAKHRFPESERVVNAIKTAVAAGTTTDSVWAGPLVDYQQFSGDFIEYLRPQTIIGKFGTGNIPSLRRVPFNIQVSGQTTGGAGYWVGEGAAKPLTKFEFENVTLGYTKVANIAVLTEELLRFSNPSAEAIVRDQLAAALIARLDTDFVDPTKAEVSGVSPASIINGVAGISSTGSDADAVRADLRALFAAYIAANVTPSSAVILMTATTALALSLMTNALGQPEFPNVNMNGGTLNGIPVIVSEYLDNSAGSAGGQVIMVNAQDVYLADDGQVQLDASREASLQMDTEPTNSAASGTGASLVSMFQTNSVAIRAERFINWKKRRSSAAQWLDAVTWGQ
jgi:HK97 family phage major capsid protein